MFSIRTAKYAKAICLSCLLLVNLAKSVHAQSFLITKDSSSHFTVQNRDTLQKIFSEKLKSAAPQNTLKNISSALTAKKNEVKNLANDSVLKANLVAQINSRLLFNTKPLIKFSNGFVAYNTNYRNNIDTPLAENNIVQHSINGNMNVAVGNIPLRINYLIRRSNSKYFRDINDIQVEFDPRGFNGLLQNNLKRSLMEYLPKLKDSLLDLDYHNKLKIFADLHQQVNDPLRLQKLLESKEILNIPLGTDSVENAKTEALKKQAREFIQQYNSDKQQLNIWAGRKDSVEKLYQKMQSNISQFKDWIRNRSNYLGDKNDLQDELKRTGIKGFEIPKKYDRLMSIKRLGIGHNQLNYSELTSKNMSLSGLNFEYNSWYYFAVAAGTVDYRFRDFVINKQIRTPQYFYMARLGIGKLDKNYFILSAFKGKKQLFAATDSGAGLRSIDITGFALETRLKLANIGYVVAEVAQSLSPDFRKNPIEKQRFDLKDETNKAFSVKFYSYLPRTDSRIEAAYKFTGANYQSFSSFQTNSTLKAWSIKADQQFFNRKLKLSASIKTNDFSNPYIVQNYKSNTVFKSLQATFRSKHFPSISIGYVPMSQLTMVDSVLTENRFQTLNGSISHSYKLGERAASSTFVYNHFFNNISDTAFAYYNAENFFFYQRIDFSYYVMNLNISHSKSPGFELNVLDGMISAKLGRFGAIGFGTKIYDFDKIINDVGWYGNLQLNLKKFGTLNAFFDNGFLPANNHRFVRNTQFNVNFIKQFH